MAQPIADVLYTLAAGAAPGDLALDYALSPTGDLALCAGSARLKQRALFWLLTPQGANPFAPQYGNPLLNALGRPNAGDADTFVAMVEAAEAYFLQSQAADAAAGQLSAAELVDHFDPPSVGFPLPGVAIVTTTIYAVSGDAQILSVPFSVSVGG